MMRPIRVASTLRVAPTPANKNTGATASWMTCATEVAWVGDITWVFPCAVRARLGNRLRVATLFQLAASKVHGLLESVPSGRPTTTANQGSGHNRGNEQ